MEENLNPPVERRHHRPSLFWPLVLIALGVIFLLSNLGVLERDVWGTLVNYWPVLLVAMGLDSILRREGLVGGVLMIGLGVVFLLSNLGFLALNVWDVVIRLWPLLLIAIGFDVLFGRRSNWASLIGAVVVLAVLAGALWALGAGAAGWRLEGRQVGQALEGARRARVELSPSAGGLTLRGTDTGNDLITGEVSSNRSNTVRENYQVDGGAAVYTLASTGTNVIGPGDRFRWDLGLSRSIPIDLKVNMGVGDANLDLSELDLAALEVDLGLGQATLQLPEGSYTAMIDGGIGQVRVTLPEEAAVRIKTDTGIAGVDLPEGLQKVGDDTYQTSNWAGSADRIDLSIDQGIGSVVVEFEAR